MWFDDIILDDLDDELVIEKVPKKKNLLSLNYDRTPN